MGVKRRKVTARVADVDRCTAAVPWSYTGEELLPEGAPAAAARVAPAAPAFDEAVLNELVSFLPALATSYSL